MHENPPVRLFAVLEKAFQPKFVCLMPASMMIVGLKVTKAKKEDGKCKSK